MIANAMTKLRTTLFISPDVFEALKVFTRMHKEYGTPSQSADKLLRDALLAQIGKERWEIISNALLEDTEPSAPRKRTEGRR